MTMRRYNIPSSFVSRKLKLSSDKGAGEAKLFIGSTRNIQEIDNFFSDFDDNNIFKVKKTQLLEYLNSVKIEYVGQRYNSYTDIGLDYFENVKSILDGLDDEFSIKIEKFADASRVYIRPTEEFKKLFKEVVRDIALPKITDLVIRKNSEHEFELSLEINFDELRKYDSNDSEEEIVDADTLPYNRIYFGAPGTGKSYGVSKLIKSVYPNFDKEDDEQSSYVFRTTLHPEYTYSDFVGQIMPVEKEDGFNYSFTPGVFTKALKKAMLENLAVENGTQEEPKKVFLVLEELSRANVAAVFGDLFQLLDRDSKGESEYSISNALISKQVNTVTDDTQEANEDKVSKDEKEDKKIFLPSNLIILATVNTNDQNVFAMDTAVKRRFEWEYVSIDPVSDKGVLLNNEIISIPSESGLKDVEWCDFYPTLNEYITSKMGLSEDKQIGQFFIKLAQDNNEKNQTQVLNKLLQYLWEDIEGMAIDTHLFNIEEIKSFGKLYSTWKDALDKEAEVQIFAKEFYDKLKFGTIVNDDDVQEVSDDSSEGEQNDTNQN